MTPVPHAVQIPQLKTLELPEVDLSDRPKYVTKDIACAVYCIFCYLTL